MNGTKMYDFDDSIEWDIQQRLKTRPHEQFFQDMNSRYCYTGDGNAVIIGSLMKGSRFFVAWPPSSLVLSGPFPSPLG